MLDRFFDLSHDMLAIASPSGSFIRVNAAFTRTLGWTEQELLGSPVETFVHPDDLQRTVAKFASMLHGVGASGFVNRFAHADSVWRWIEWRGVHDPLRGMAYAAARDVTESVRMRQGLEARERVLRELVAEHVRVRDEELQRIAGDLHDSVMQHLIASLMFEEGASASGPQTPELRELATAGIRSALQEVRRIMQGIDPLDVGVPQLEAAVRVSAREIAERHDKVVHVDLDLPTDLDGPTAGVVYRIVREAMTNAGKHSRGHHIWVQIAEHERLVRDDGRALHDGTGWQGAGLGTMLMHERAASIGGTLDIQFAETGTCVSAELPIAASAGRAPSPCVVRNVNDR